MGCEKLKDLSESSESSELSISSATLELVKKEVQILLENADFPDEVNTPSIIDGIIKSSGLSNDEFDSVSTIFLNECEKENIGFAPNGYIGD